MKRLLLTLAVTLACISAKAMSYERAREEALYLTDKMAYELNLNDQQYNDAYEINLDYLMSMNSEADLFGTYFAYRMSDFSTTGSTTCYWPPNISCGHYFGALAAGTFRFIRTTTVDISTLVIRMFT